MVELKPGGAQIPVTESNKKEYLDLLAQYRLSSSVKQEIEAFAKGSPFLIATPILQKREGSWPELTFAKTSGTVTRDRETMGRYDPRINCGRHFGSSSLLVFEVANRGLSFFGSLLQRFRFSGCFVFPFSLKIIVFKFQSIRNLFIEANWTSGTGPGIRLVNSLYEFLCIIGQ